MGFCLVKDCRWWLGSGNGDLEFVYMLVWIMC